MLSEFHVLTDHWPEIFNGLALTLYTWLTSVVIGAFLGLAIALLRQEAPRPIALVIDGYVGLFRGTPFLIQLFLLYYGGPFVGLSLPPVVAGIVGLSLYASAYFSEIFRSGFQSVPLGQTEAAAICGLTKTQTLLRVTLPQ
ncbi:ABC transporter permease subunit, partial [Mesorhizobium sp. M7D.F.Ca.US.004.03.1.1]|uniref:amino acid ABC transporter permease n=1 Tax=Mesorhizobium sp. M7D.F.Ca.US.004.03.1.1 TaxID=2496702 RepID=UPI000FCA8CE5